MLSDEKIRERLKKLRGHLAYRGKREPYKIFPDIHLEELVKYKPKTIEELVKVKGFPEDGKRVKGYGEAIIAAIHQAMYEDVEVVDNGSGVLECKIILRKSSSF